MQKKFTFYARIIARIALIVVALAFNSFTIKTYAQITCQSETPLFSENFGTGTIATNDTNVISTALAYLTLGPLAGEGTYRVINSSRQKPEWHASDDHTANDENGKMLVVNGEAETFYSHRVDAVNGFFPSLPSSFIASFYIMNIDTPGTCAPNPLLPMITIRVEYLSADGTWQPLTGSPYTAPIVTQAATPTWVLIGSSFSIPSTGSFLVKSLRMVISDGTKGGCGNDFAMDDVKFSRCPGSGETPVEFLNINARQKGSGISIEWSTAQELNNKSFDVEKSADGNANWNLVSSVNGAGNSSTVKNYSAYDPQPFNGVNFYRIKQVDIDGHFKYSKTVSVKLNAKTGVSVVANPFHTSLTVDFTSSTDQQVTARLLDITGKQVLFEKWSINSGSSRKDFSNVNGLQRGIYLLSVSNADGEIIYNNKVIKQ